MNVDNSIFEYNGPTQYSDEAVRVWPGATMYMDNCTIRNNTNQGLYAQGLVEATNCLFEDNGWRGYTLQDPNSITSGCMVRGNGSFGVTVHPNLVGQVADQDSLYNNGHLNNMYVTAGTIDDSAYWPNTYGLVIGGDVTIASGASVTVEKGETIKFNGTYGMTINGQLVAIGDPVEKVV